MRKSNMITPSIIFLTMLASCASTQKTYQTFSDWDADKNETITRQEFVDAYLAQNYFGKWSSGGSSITYQGLFSQAYTSMDGDHDEKLSLIEFNSQIKLFYFGLFNGSFDQWDEDSNANISKTEFDKRVSGSNLATLWDTDGDKRISEREMAGGMFYICDADGNGKVSDVELNTWKRNRRSLNT